MTKLSLSEKIVLTTVHMVQCSSFLKNLHLRLKSKLLLKKLSQPQFRPQPLKVLRNRRLTLKKIMNSIMSFVKIKPQKRNLKNQKKNAKSQVHLIKHLPYLMMKKKKRKKHLTMKHTPMLKKKIKDLTSQHRKDSQE